MTLKRLRISEQSVHRHHAWYRVTCIRVQRKLWVGGKIEQDLRKKGLLCRKWKESEESVVHSLGRRFRNPEDV